MQTVSSLPTKTSRYPYKKVTLGFLRCGAVVAAILAAIFAWLQAYNPFYDINDVIEWTHCQAATAEECEVSPEWLFIRYFFPKNFVFFMLPVLFFCLITCVFKLKNNCVGWLILYLIPLCIPAILAVAAFLRNDNSGRFIETLSNAYIGFGLPSIILTMTNIFLVSTYLPTTENLSKTDRTSDIK